MGKELLQRVVMPGVKERDCQKLFFRFSQTECMAFGEPLVALNELYFNTWMNLFAAKKWFHYGAVRNLFLKLDIKGDFCVEIVGSNQNAAYGHIDEKLIFEEFRDNQEERYIKIDNPAAYDAVYFIIRDRKDAPCRFRSAGWYTDIPPVRENILAIVICTYKREAYIHKAMAMFENYLSENEALRNRMHLFVIDNGKTLDLSRSNEYVTVFYNINAGGAGGFARGLIEACRAREDYTRCLFMDDDVEIIPESFYRTLVLADYLREEYKDAVINGAMLDLYHKNIFVENLAVEDGLWVAAYHQGANLTEFEEILKVNDIPESVYHNKRSKANAAWFYSCFPMDKEKSINDLPLPVFIRGDDVEYGRRKFGKAFIQLNGICVWHAPFYYRVGKATEAYYMSRNMFMINALYSDGFKKNFGRLYSAGFRYSLDTYDYVSAQLYIRALEDVLKGSRVFDEDVQEIAETVGRIAEEAREPVTDFYELKAVKDKPFHYARLKRICVRLIQVCYKCVPASKCVLKRKGMNLAQEWYPPVETFLIKRHVKVYNLLNKTSVLREFDYHMERKLKKQFRKLLAEIEKNYDSLLKDYRTNLPRLTSFDFWKKYLNLE
ncbi:glycosyltransferase [Parablautia muri]|uniref:Galactofuranosyltransferase GlfT2 N-terminal domain-containing protein n=1 Tax=Parablautia muri TaxID=2320879 RepID=A0A9X5GRU0_9FIRM|nr:glycosyltransferase [Parablautia muri]NBJ92679.1 hypothetical protein [Parablautia muri]